MSKELIIIIVESIVLVVMAAVIVFLVVRAKRSGKTKAGNVYVKDGVRYTRDKVETTETGDVKITHNTGDVLLERGITYVVRKDGKIIPGKYTVLAAQEGTPVFNIRQGDFVREFKHASDLVLCEGETVCAVSHSVILR